MNSHVLRIRLEQPADRDSVHAVNVAAFGGSAEADVVDALRGVASPNFSLVADVDGKVVGHILFTPVRIEPDQKLRGMGLAPLAVHPDCQGRGIGSALVRAGTDACREAGEAVVFVVGHARYYPRFGFERAARRGFRWDREIPEELFMVMELAPGALEGKSGIVHYLPQFDSI